MESNLEVRTEDLTCPICFEMYDTPVVWHCGHNTCQKCVTRCQEHLVLSGKSRQFLICCVCRQVTDLSDSFATNLPRNIELISLIQRIKLTQQRNSTCSLCLSLPSQVAVYVCLNCDLPCCEGCKIKHQSSRNTGHHVIRPLEYKVVENICSFHHKELILFCKSCNKYICETCATYSLEHRQHSIIDIYSLRNELLPNLQGLYVKLQKRISELESYLNHQSKEYFETLQQVKLKEIEQIYQEAVQKLQEQKEIKQQQAEEQLQKAQDILSLDLEQYFEILKEMKKTSIQCDDARKLKCVENNILRLLSISLPKTQGFDLKIEKNPFSPNLVSILPTYIQSLQEDIHLVKDQQLTLDTIKGNFEVPTHKILIYVCQNSIAYFDTQNEKWAFTKQQNHNQLFQNPSIVPLPNGKFFICGGMLESQQGQNNVYLIEPLINQEPKPLKFMIKPRHLHCANLMNTLANKNFFEIFVSGGINDKIQKIADCEIYNSENDIWRKATPMLEPRYEHASIKKGNCIISFGGRDEQSSLVNFIDLYEIKNDRWIRLLDVLPIDATFMGTCAISTNQMILYGYYLEATYQWEHGKKLESIASSVSEGSSFNIYPSVLRNNAIYNVSYTGNVFCFKLDDQQWLEFKRPGGQ